MPLASNTAHNPNGLGGSTSCLKANRDMKPENALSMRSTALFGDDDSTSSSSETDQELDFNVVFNHPGVSYYSADTSSLDYDSVTHFNIPSLATTMRHYGDYRLPLRQAFYLERLARLHHPDFFCLLAMAQHFDRSFDLPHDAVKDYRIHPYTHEFMDAPNPPSIQDYWGPVNQVQGLLDQATVDPRAFQCLMEQHMMHTHLQHNNFYHQQYCFEAITSPSPVRRDNDKNRNGSYYDSGAPWSYRVGTRTSLSPSNSPNRDPFDNMSDIMDALPESPTSTIITPRHALSSEAAAVKSFPSLPQIPSATDRTGSEIGPLPLPQSELEPMCE